jgi:hypothetical protein
MSERGSAEGRRPGRRRLAAVAAILAGALAVSAFAREGPYDIPLFNTPRTAGATGQARLFYAPSPFGIAVTADGRDRYDVRVTVKGLPAPSSLGPYAAYVAWEVTPDLATWHRLGRVANGTSVVGTTGFNKFLFVITAEASATPDGHHGPTVLHGNSPSGWLESFLSHDAFFRGVY